MISSHENFMNKIIAVFFALILLPFSSSVLASGWSPIGSTSVNRSLDKDDIRVASKGFFNALAVEVRGAPVFIGVIVVEYGKDERMELPVNKIVKPGERTRPIQLPGHRIVRKVTFYQQAAKQGSKDRAEVVLWGKK